MRLFTAIELNTDIQHELSSLQDRHTLNHARWIKPSNLHITLRFIGDVEMEQLVGLQNAMSTVDVEPFQLHIQGAGTFPKRRRARVLWLGLSQRELLRQLHRQIERQLQRLGFEAEGQPFHPHVTLARLKPGAHRDLPTILEQLQTFQSQPFSVQRFTLFHSEQTDDGPIYHPVANFGRSASKSL